MKVKSTELKIGDVVLFFDGNRAHVGKITSFYTSGGVNAVFTCSTDHDGEWHLLAGEDYRYTLLDPPSETVSGGQDG